MKKIIFAFLIFLTGCQNPYKTHYVKTPSYNSKNVVLFKGDPLIIRSNNVSADAASYQEASYQQEQYDIIGTANFSDGDIKDPESKIKKAAKDVGAKIVLWSQTPYESTYDYETAFLVKIEGTKFGYFPSNIVEKKSNRTQSDLDYNGIFTALGISLFIAINHFIQILPLLIL